MKAKVKRTSASSVEPQKVKSRDQEADFRIQNSGFKTRYSKPETRNIIVGFLFFLALTGCGYHFLQGGEAIPQDVRTVFIEPFVNRSQAVGIEQEIASALRSEFHRKGRLEVVDRIDQADAVLSGVVRSVEHHVVSVNRHEEVLQFEMALVVDATLRRRTPDQILLQLKGKKLAEDYAGSRAAVVTTSSEFQRGTLNAADVRRLSDIRLTETLKQEVREELVEGFALQLYQRLMEAF